MGCQGTVKSSGYSHGSGDKGKWDLYSPPPTVAQAAQEGASLLEKGSQTWADPLVWTSIHREPLLCEPPRPSCAVSGTPGGSRISFVSPLGLQPLADPRAARGVEWRSDWFWVVPMLRWLSDRAGETWGEGQLGPSAPACQWLGLSFRQWHCECVSSLMFADLYGHRGVPSPHIACLRAQVTSHGKAGVLTQSRGGGISALVFLSGHLDGGWQGGLHVRDSGLRQVIVAQRRRVFLLPGPWRAGLGWKDQAVGPRLRGQCHSTVRLPFLVPLALQSLARVCEVPR